MSPGYFIHAQWKRRLYFKYTRHYEKRFLIRLAKVFALLLMLIMAHTGGMMVLEKMSFSDALWLSITTVTTVGYGDFSAATWQGRLVTTLLLYVFAISLLAQLAAEFFDYRLLIRERKVRGHWRWKDMKDHLLIINTPNDHTEIYLKRLLKQVRKTPLIEELPVQILTRKYDSGLPGSLSNLGAVHFSGVAENNENLKTVNVDTAKFIIIIARDPGDPTCDSLSFDVLDRIHEIGTKALIVAEVSQDNNRERIKKAGADVILRPIRAYPELLVRSLVAPGTEQVMENLFTHDSDHMVRIDLSFKNKIWSDIVCSFVTGDIGLPIAYVGDQGVNVNPLPGVACSGTAVIVLINECQQVSMEKAKKYLG